VSQRASLEVIAPTVEEAVAKGLAELGLPEDAVEVEILDAGSRGLFGLGARQARVRLMIKGAQPAGTLSSTSRACQPPLWSDLR
jgi:spoIIIJ-associated protein